MPTIGDPVGGTPIAPLSTVQVGITLDKLM